MVSALGRGFPTNQDTCTAAVLCFNYFLVLQLTNYR